MESTRILKSIAFGITFFMTIYVVLSLIGSIFCTSFHQVVTEPNWFAIYGIINVIPSVGMGKVYYEDLCKKSKNNTYKNIII